MGEIGSSRTADKGKPGNIWAKANCRSTSIDSHSIAQKFTFLPYLVTQKLHPSKKEKKMVVEIGENPDLAEERRRANFDPKKLGNYFWEGQLARKQQILEYVEAQGDELRPKMPTTFMNRMEQLEDVARLVGGI